MFPMTLFKAAKSVEACGNPICTSQELRQLKHIGKALVEVGKKKRSIVCGCARNSLLLWVKNCQNCLQQRSHKESKRSLGAFQKGRAELIHLERSAMVACCCCEEHLCDIQQSLSIMHGPWIQSSAVPCADCGGRIVVTVPPTTFHIRRGSCTGGISHVFDPSIMCLNMVDKFMLESCWCIISVAPCLVCSKGRI